MIPKLLTFGFPNQFKFAPLAYFDTKCAIFLNYENFVKMAASGSWT